MGKEQYPAHEAHFPGYEKPIAWRWRDNEHQTWNFIDADHVHMDYVFIEPLYAQPVHEMPLRGVEPTEDMLIAGEEAYHSAPKDEDGCTKMAAAFKAMLRHASRNPQEHGLKHPEYAHGISDAELIKEAIAFCDEELDAYEGMEYDDDCEVACQRSNTFIRELVFRLVEAAIPKPETKMRGKE